MQVLGFLALAAAAKLASAHATVQAAWINGVDQGLGNSASGYIRSPPNNSPLVDVKSTSMTCNVNNVATAKTLSVKAGDKFEFEWHHDSRSPSDDIIDPSHRGPVLVYIAPTDKGTAGNGWVKLSEDGFDGTTWGVERLRANAGKHSITIPNIAPGDYLLRPEIIALHEGDRLNGAQFYMECVQIKITSAGTTTLPAGVSIPGTYSATDPGIFFDLYNGVKPYPIPGPPVWDGASSDPAPAPSTTSEPAPASTTTTKAPATSVPATSAPTVTATSAPVVPTTLTTVVRPSSTPAPPAATDCGTVAVYQQCGGINYTGATTCQSGLICKDWNPYYFQCIPA